MPGNNNNNNEEYNTARNGSNSNIKKKLADKIKINTINTIKSNTFIAIIQDLIKDGLLKKITNENNKKGNTPSANESERAAHGTPPIIYNKLNLDTNNINDDVIKREVDKNIALFNAIVKNIPSPNNININMKEYLKILS